MYHELLYMVLSFLYLQYCEITKGQKSLNRKRRSEFILYQEFQIV
jgi:hypothetical protein